MSYKFLSRVITSALPIMAMSSSVSASDIFVRDGQNITLDISHDFPTRLSFKNDVGKQFIFNTVDGNSPTVSTTIGQSGDVFVSVTKGKVGDSLGGFITTSQGFTYPVDVKISDKKQDHIVVLNTDLASRIAVAKKDVVKEAAKDLEPSSSVPQRQWSHNSGQYQATAELMRSLYHRYGFEGFDAIESYSPLSLDPTLSETFKYGLASSKRVGVVSVLRNSSTQALDLQGLVRGRRDLIAIAFGVDFLAPGETTFVYSIRRRVL